MTENNNKNPRRTRFIELFVAGVILFIVIAGTLLQLTVFGADSWIFVVILNLNIILLLIVIFLVSRNILKLILERRRRVFGSRLRTRLMLAFIAISLIPLIIMFLASNRVIATNLDYWFTSQVENSMEAALEIGQSFYDTYTSKLENTSYLITDELEAKAIKLDSQEADELIAKVQANNSLDLAGILNSDMQEVHWYAKARFVPVWLEAQNLLNLEQNKANNNFDSILITSSTGDYVITILGLGKEQGYLVLAENIGKGILLRMESISQGFAEYAYLKNMKRPLKLSFTLILGLLGITMFFGAVWVAFRLSKELTAPIQALAEGAMHLAKGDDYVLTDKGQDELRELVDSFNFMADEVTQNRQKLTNANQLLEKRNLTMQLRNKYIETVLDNIATGVITLSKNPIKQNIQILTMNKAACLIFETSREQWEGRSPSLFFSKEHQKVFMAMIDYLDHNPTKAFTKEIEVIVPPHHWKLLLQAVALPESDLQESEGAYVVVIEDISELARMQRQSAWAEVAKKIAHEIKNPLTPIKLCAERLQKKFGSEITDPAFAESTRLIIDQSERLLNMVNEFSSFARLPEIKLIPNDLAKLLEELLLFIRPTHKNIVWHLNNNLDSPVKPAMILMDYNALYAALLNILNNSADAATKEDAKVEISLSSGLSPEGASIILEIADNGTGLDYNELDKIFEPYFSRKQGGTGLGLAIVRTTIEKHNAKISAKLQEKSGLIFTIEFPAYKNNLN